MVKGHDPEAKEGYDGHSLVIGGARFAQGDKENLIEVCCTGREIDVTEYVLPADYPSQFQPSEFSAITGALIICVLALPLLPLFWLFLPPRFGVVLRYPSPRAPPINAVATPARSV